MNMTVDKINHIDMIHKVEKYLSEFGWDAITIGSHLMGFERIHGDNAVQAMNRFIDWAEEHKERHGWIAAQLGHDLKEFAKTGMYPRTSGY